jgi:hypothetical protein
LGEPHTLHIRLGKLVDENRQPRDHQPCRKLSWNEVFSFKQGREEL